VKFELRYPNGNTHEVLVEGARAVVGRDPSADIVLNDPRCSRRHAIFEASQFGLGVRDCGSSNGILVNGQPVDRASLNTGDEVVVGSVIIKVLSDVVARTEAMEQDNPPDPTIQRSQLEMRSTPDLQLYPQGRSDRGPSASWPSLPYANPAQTHSHAPRHSRPIAQPLTVTTLISFCLLTIPCALILAAVWGVLGYRATLHVSQIVLPPALFIATAFLFTIVSIGLMLRAAWGRMLLIAISIAGVLSCVFSPLAAMALVYLFRPESRIYFSGRRRTSDLAAMEKAALTRSAAQEPTFMMLMLGVALLTLLGASVLVSLNYGRLRIFFGNAGVKSEHAVTERLRTLASAQDSFRNICATGYADLDGLLQPAAIVPNYPANGPAFVPAEYGQGEARGYRFTLLVAEQMPPADGCPTRRYRRYTYSAVPVVGTGRHYMIGPDLRIRFHESRPAQSSDPVLVPQD
jgi:hypothetical protein